MKHFVNLMVMKIINEIIKLKHHKQNRGFSEWIHVIQQIMYGNIKKMNE